ncbi:M14 family metallopeptidase [candidate division KSB1 bacterium]
MRLAPFISRLIQFILTLSLILNIPMILFGQESSSEQDTSFDLGGIFNKGYILQDRNNDDVIDFLDLRIVLPAEPVESDVVSAANIAARLGYETTGLNFDFVAYDPDFTVSASNPVILIGKNNRLLEKTGEDVISNSLRPGQGELIFLKEGNFFKKGGLIVRGYDDTGLMGVSDYFAGRYPSIWDLKGKNYSNIRDQFEKFLEQREITGGITLVSLVVDKNYPGVQKLSISIVVPDAEDFNRTVTALEQKETIDETDKKLLKVSDLEFKDLHRIAIRVTSPDNNKSMDLLPRKPWQTKLSTNRSSASSPGFTLSEIYSNSGIYKDSNQDFIPDNVVSYISLSGAEHPEGVIYLAARIGLESAGIRIPLVLSGGEENYPERDGFPILFGTDHYTTNKILKENEFFSWQKSENEGFILFAEGAVNDKNGLIISGVNTSGLKAASEYAAKKMPYLWDYGKGNFHIKDVETDVRRFLQSRNASGQTALALEKLRTWLERIKEKEIETINIDLAVKDNPEALDDFVTEFAGDIIPDAKITARTFKTGFGEGKEIFKENFDIPWEVDDFWKIFNNKIGPVLNSGSSGKITVRLSESPEIRNNIRDKIINELKSKGIENSVEVSILCAYKQGYSWLYDEVLPQIRNKDIGKVDIKYHNLKNSKEVKWQSVYSNTRWLQELYPVDAVLARELNIPDSLVTFSSTLNKDPIYKVTVYDRSGREVFSDTFDPKYVIRPFFDLFPEYESIRVTTGWVNAEINGNVIADERIKTDPEKFWDHLQNTTYGKIIEYVMDLQEGRPSSNNAPYFDEFKIDLTLSEPNYRIGIDEEVISSPEALHEDIYFETLTLFNLIGSRYGGGSMNYPGRILPYIHPPVDGKSGKAEITFTGKKKAAPEMKLTYVEKGKEPFEKRFSIGNLGVNAPDLRGISIVDGEEGLKRLFFEAEATDSTSRYEEFKERSTESSIDRTYLSIQRITDMIKIFGDMHSAGLFEQELSYDIIDELYLRIALDDSIEYSKFALLSKTKNPKKISNPVLSNDSFKYNGDRIVQWDNPIGLDENSEILSKLNTLPGANVYFMTESFLGNDVYAIDVTPPYESEYMSQAKLNALKPTAFFSGRQHANEVSSTSHILRLAELLLTDEVYREYLKNVNVVLHPITNADGAMLGYEIQKTNPDFMIHAAYLGALGVDVDSERNTDDPRYPESAVRQRIRETWLPDVYINMHGYPSHEWVQYFAGYSAWVRNRSGGQRSWWSPRGWFIPGFSWIEDDRFPDHKTAAFAILDSIAAGITAIPEAVEQNKSLFKRYKKYGKQPSENFTEYFHNGILVNASIKGRNMSGSGVTSPKITYFSITTEAPDETARGDWLKVVCEEGLASSTAVLKYLSDGVNKVEHKTAEFDKFVTRSVSRTRPVIPQKPKDEKKEQNK